MRAVLQTEYVGGRGRERRKSSHIPNTHASCLPSCRYQIRLGTVDQQHAENEWVLRSYTRSAKKQRLAGGADGETYEERAGGGAAGGEGGGKAGAAAGKAGGSGVKGAGAGAGGKKVFGKR